MSTTSFYSKAKISQLLADNPAPILSGLQQLSALGESLSNDVTARIDSLSKVEEALSLAEDVKVGSSLASAEMRDAFNALRTTVGDQELSLNDNFRVLQLRASTYGVHESINVKFGAVDTPLFVNTSGTITVLPDAPHQVNESCGEWMTRQFGSVDDFLDSTAQGLSVTQEIGEFCSTVSQMPTAFQRLADETFQQSNDTITTMIDNLRTVPASWKGQMAASILCGAEGLANTISSLFNRAERDATAFAADRDYSIDFADVAPGLILSTIGSIATMAACALATVSRVAALAVAALGMVTTFVGKIVTAFTEAAAGVAYKYHNGEVRFFDFAVSAYDYTTTADLSELGQYFTIINNRTATVCLCCVTSVNNGVTQVHVEEHLSVDFNLLNDVTPDPNDEYIIVGDVTFHKEVSGELWFNPTGLGPESIPATRQPLDLTFFSQIKDMYDGVMNGELARRLASALLIWSWQMICVSDNGDRKYLWYTRNSVSDLVPLQKIWIRNARNLPWETHTDIDAMDVVGLAMVAGAWFWYCTINNAIGNVSYNPDWNDEMLKTIQIAFNGLSYRNHILTTRTAGRMTFFYDDPNMGDLRSADWTMPVQSTVYGSSIFVPVNYIRDCLATAVLFDGDHLLSHPYGWDITPDILSYSLTYPTTAAVELPSTLWSSFVRGIIVDIAIVAVAAIVAVVTIVAVKKIKTKLAQKKAVAAHQYDDYAKAAAEHGANSPEAQAAWKQYKKTRFSANLLATASGQDKLSLGYWDASASQESSISLAAGLAKIHHDIIGG